MDQHQNILSTNLQLADPC